MHNFVVSYANRGMEDVSCMLDTEILLKYELLLPIQYSEALAYQPPHQCMTL